jgi:DcmR-like sensory protein/putative zinc finger protein
MSSGSAACRELEDRITAYLEGHLPPADRRRFEAHCRSCSACRVQVAQMQTVVASLGRMGGLQEPATSMDKERLLDLFHDHGLHRPGPRRPDVPLGLAQAVVTPGDHLAYFWESEREFDDALGFVAAGVRQSETCLLVGPDEINARIEAGLKRAGLAPTALRRDDRLQFVPGKNSGDALLDEVGDRVKAAVDRGEPFVRVLGNLGWGKPGWPGDRELLRLEARVTEAIRKLPAIVMCVYDVRGIAARNLLQGGLECHPLTFRRNVVRPNEHYVPAEPFLAALDRDLD